MDRIAQLDAIISQFDLSTHPFYVEWREGTLPVERLREYAAEYARFIDTVDEGWDRIGEPKYGEIEREHERLWSRFQLEIAAGRYEPNPSIDTLVSAARNSFKSKPEAVGALYAFEAQQPETAQSKLDGLTRHYSISEAGREYFKVHAKDIAEAVLLKTYIEALSDGEFARAKTACAVLCAAMWGALDGVYYQAA